LRDLTAGKAFYRAPDYPKAPYRLPVYRRRFFRGIKEDLEAYTDPQEGPIRVNPGAEGLGIT
jgi:hypothetical protein